MRFPKTLCEQHVGAAFSALTQGALESAEKALGAAREALEQMNRDIGEDIPPTPEELTDLIGHIENIEGTILLNRGRVREAVGHLEHARDQFRKTGNEALPMAINSLGIAHRRIGQLDEAMACYRECIDLLKTRGDELNVCMLQQNVGNLCQSVGRHGEAIAWYAKAIDGFDRMDRKGKVAEVQLSLAQSCLALRDWDQAEHAYRLARQYYVREGDETAVAVIDHNLTKISASRGRE